MLNTAAEIEANVLNLIRFFSFGLSATLFSAKRSIIFRPSLLCAASISATIKSASKEIDFGVF